jgi:hypothetical protein
VLPPLKPIAMKERISPLFIEKGEIDVLDGAFVVIDKNGIRTHIPVGSIACIMLEPGTRVSRRAAALAARVGTLLVWVGEAGVRLYASGQPGGARSDVVPAHAGMNGNGPGGYDGENSQRGKILFKHFLSWMPKPLVANLVF